MFLQSTVVKNWNPIESLKGQLKCSQDNKAQVTKHLTDRHTQVSAYNANEKPDIKHGYDVWHVVNISKFTKDIASKFVTDL